MSWQEIIKQEAAKPYFQQLSIKLIEDGKQHTIYPPHADVFNALKHCPLNKVKVVILGMDPYHGPKQAHGLAFSVQPGIVIPPSLLNIFKELKSDLGHEVPNHGHLIQWARQGVLLLNAVLTVRQGQAGSHKNYGWEHFTDRILTEVNNQDRPIVHILWGAFARSKKQLIINPKHLVLEAVHPSPLSAYNGFFGSRPFGRTNQFLLANNVQPIDWQLSNAQV